MISSKENKARDFPLRNPDYNPMPEPHTAGYATCPDGVKLRYAVWLPAQENAKGTILFLPGRTEVIEKGYETIRDFQAKGFAVLSFDWRGQGGSDRLLEDPEKGYVDEFDEYVMDLETIINDVALPDCRAPFYIVAHSMGALISMLAAPRFPNKIRRMVLCSTFLGIGNQRVSAGTIKLVTGAMTALGLGDMVIGRGRTSVEKQKSSDSFLTADIDRLARNNRFIDENPDLSIGAPTASWIFAAGKAIDQVLDPDFTSAVSIPILFLVAGNDRIVDNNATEELAQRLRSGSSLTITGANHELFQELDLYRQQCLAAIFSFIPGSDTR